ncbi:MAG: c-type cytochrome [Bradymonadaceae bacterium]|nr:c-type cytochrome [Lujinxingiaceae bacterium]
MNAPNKSASLPEPSEQDDVLITGHDYDGIMEYDNPMPGWWLAILYLTIVWSIFYVAGMGLGFINSYEDDLKHSMIEINEMRRGAVAAAPNVDQSYLAGLVGNAEVIDTGRQAYAFSCAVCHAAEGQGQIGPNLTDDHWLHGGELVDIYKAIYDGVPAKGMPAWGSVLSSAENVALAVFIDSLRGTEPANPKAAQGKPMGGD